MQAGRLRNLTSEEYRKTKNVRAIRIRSKTCYPLEFGKKQVLKRRASIRM